MKPEEFGNAASDVISATLRIYIETAHLVRELRAELQQRSLAAFPFASVSDGDPGWKTLKGWRGLLAAPGLYEPRKGKHVAKEVDPDDEDGDGGKGRGRILKMLPGRPLLFAKILLHDYPRKIAPSFVGGVLCGATTTARSPSLGGLRCNSEQARKILEVVEPGAWAGEPVTLYTDAKVQIEAAPQKGGKKKTPKLQFELRQEPIRRSLWELDSTDTVQQLAEALQQQWAAAGGK